MKKYRESVANFLLKERKVNIISDIPERIKCTICKMVIVNAKQSPCGCRYCCDCITAFLNGESKYCPGQSIDCQEEPIDINKNIINDFGIDREIRRLRYRCQNIGCTFENELGLIDDHLQVCQYGEDRCELCGGCMRRMDLHRHQTDSCANRTVVCPHCGTGIVAKKLAAEHLNIDSKKLCHRFVAVCPLKCSAREPVVISDHRPLCSNRPRDCPFGVAGCPARGFTKKELNGHIRTHIFEHSRILLAKLSGARQEMESLRARLDEAEEALFSHVWTVEGLSSLRGAASGPFRLGGEDLGYRVAMELVVVSADDAMCTGESTGEHAGDRVRLRLSALRGDQDGVGRWPIEGRVTVSILDQEGRGRHLSRSMGACVHRDALCTFEHFVALEHLAESAHLTRGDRLFVRCTLHA